MLPLLPTSLETDKAISTTRQTASQLKRVTTLEGVASQLVIVSFLNVKRIVFQIGLIQVLTDKL